MTDTGQVVVCPACSTKNRVPKTATGTPRCGRCHAALPWVVDAGDDNFSEVVDASTVPVLVDLWAPWCGPCRMVSPALERLAHEQAGKLKLVKVDVDQAPRVAARFSVQSIPTLLLVKGGQVVARQVGASGEAALRTWLTDQLASTP
jgi:thioredoxin 2